MSRIVVHKQEIPLTENFELHLPYTYSIIHIEAQRDKPFMWYAFNEEYKDDTRARKFKLLVTEVAEDMGSRWTHVGTFQLGNGNFVGHVFEVVE